MAEDTKKSVDLKNLDLKDIGGLLKAGFGKGSMSNPTMLFIVFGFLASFILAYLIYGMIDNQTLYDQEQTKYNQNKTELATLPRSLIKLLKVTKNILLNFLAVRKLMTNYRQELLS